MSETDARTPPEDRPVPKLLQALDEAGYDDVLLLDTETFRTVFTERRDELLDAIAEADDLSVGELANRLDRQQSAVSRDLDVLFEHSLIEYERDGRRKIPKLRHETILHASVL